MSLPGTCDNCGTALIQRNDDKEETVKERLKVYHKNTEELVPHYHRQGLLLAVHDHHLHRAAAEDTGGRVQDHLCRAQRPGRHPSTYNLKHQGNPVRAKTHHANGVLARPMIHGWRTGFVTI